MDWYNDVLEFHRKFGCHIGATPAQPPTNIRNLRLDLVAEEVAELEDAAYDGNLPKVADAIADAVYVLLGTAVAYGIDIRPVFAEVHRTNMAKEGGPTRPDGKILKPEGWQPPDVAGIIAAQQRAAA
jgi:predicted HAD superfamily Cof-like phosphohydrolase